MKYPHHALLVFFCITITFVGSAKSETKTWDGGDGFWDEFRWNGGGSPPVLDGTDDAVIGSGVVTYDSFGIQDFVVDPGSDLTVNGGGTWANSNPEWTEINGSLQLDGGSFARTSAGGVLYLGGGRGAIANETVTLSISLGGTLQNEGEVWLGDWENTVDNLVVNITIDDGTLDVAPVTGFSNHSIFLIIPDNNPTWQASGATQGPTYNINFTGDSGTMVVGADGIVRPQYDDVGSQWFWSPLSYETLWDIGILQAAGASGLTGADFNNHFAVTGTVDQPNYTLTFLGALVDGDFNDDGNWDCIDINALVAAVASGSTDLDFDMNGDGQITLADISDATLGWLAVGGANNVGATGGNPFLVGDATLDGVVDGLDFIEWNNNKFTSLAEWCGGDFNADGIVDGLDFILWNDNKFTSSDSVSAVPEPGAGVLLIASLISLAVARRR